MAAGITFVFPLVPCIGTEHHLAVPGSGTAGGDGGPFKQGVGEPVVTQPTEVCWLALAGMLGVPGVPQPVEYTCDPPKTDHCTILTHPPTLF